LEEVVLAAAALQVLWTLLRVQTQFLAPLHLLAEVVVAHPLIGQRVMVVLAEEVLLLVARFLLLLLVVQGILQL
jgi:hypothetical protein